MKRLVCSTPGTFQYEKIERPEFTVGHTILRIRKIGICGTDLHAFEGTQPFFNYPRVLGHELAGEVIKTDGAEGFSVGDQVTFIPYFNCGSCVSCRNGKPNCCSTLQVFGVHIDGGMVEYVSVPSYSLVQGRGLSLEELALVEPLAIGAHAIRRAEVSANDTVLVVGAGPIGLGAMEFARIAGARVIALDINENRLAFCRNNIKVNDTINAASEDVTKVLAAMTDGDMPTIVLDATGSLNAINNAFRYMSHAGKYVLVGLQRGDISFSHPEFHKREGTLMSSRNATRQDFEHVIDCIAKGFIDPKNYITHRVDFDDVKDHFQSWLDPANGVIKAMVTLK